MKEVRPKGQTIDFPKEGSFHVVFTPEEDI
jgi:hypothetical protein